ncbi:tannase/feruloyl esterase family alpha/beta hydrolase [Ideonella azotifigens]|uniref:Tannase/feruloyl esterase family alpha/beta hydrolase n=1 Tax=Ideonella azotifigens TaxID=513160 RepID=A0ABN1KKL9_9BURK|nr:tannase/feruloyl esterase family alpha/beta hydrolase [Ideonella azotifigens]MCD2339206.1 tannase/feruloyl esterase family alpha/beta hydrolase [Ideonella azotifigens]
MRSFPFLFLPSLLASATLCACGGSDRPIARLSPASAGTLSQCSTLVASFGFANTILTAATDVAAGTLTVAGQPVPAHCLVTGTMNARTGTNGSYAIGFELRLPVAWNGRFYYQANGGLDGAVVTALGGLGGGPLTGALLQGFAVLSSDAGHSNAQNAPGAANFGNDPQARLDYGYQAVGTLTPMAKQLVQASYGRAPDRAYIGGCSNGGRHTMVAAARDAEQYDGYLVGDPGFHLPRAAIANIAGYQQYLTLASTSGDASTGFSQAERALVSNAVLARCDALDGATDGLVQDVAACRGAFSLDRDVPTCAGTRDGTCLSSEQKAVIEQLFAGAKAGDGSLVYAAWPYDAGLATNGWASWKFSAPATRDSVAVGQVWQAPPEDAATFVPTTFAATGSIDQMLARVMATTAVFTESAWHFMVPPNETELSTLKYRGAKMLVYHGASDPIFSHDDTLNWYQALAKANGGDASDFARFYSVPGMNHCSGGPATDQFDMLSQLVAWVEQGQAPGAITATARGPGNAGGVNADVPATWSATRTRPLCPSPQVARYQGSGSLDDAANFSCQ